MRARGYIILACILGTLGVILGAFGAHYLAERLEITQLNSYKTGVLYHFFHTLLLLILAYISLNQSSKFLRGSLIFCVLGILLFSGSLYLLSTRFLLGIESWSFLGPITPIGGLCFIISWIFAALHFAKANPQKSDN